jgi:chitinase
MSISNFLFHADICILSFWGAALLRVDLDIEQGVSTGYAAFVNQLRERAKEEGTNQLYITAAPQCPFPDAYIGQALNDAPFDAVYVQFCMFLLLA